ncbi:hypothetical protein Q3G72_028922 [Acer saccharum]|nr:hypothetical protein Q3G72_001885 [Acer saccharum]KAK1566821.1 hypothetical protein Q3G72_004619 [Acer saccharum]KAK1581602.1 hypothetical protein Q3G72_007327 [Acer saccharum]KAK1583990.1 hypothetical protein Q3G72_028922 [Acer saccharum]
MTEALETQVKSKVSIKGHLHTYRFCDNVWTFILQNALFKNEECQETNDSEDYDLEDRSDSSESLEMLKEDNELNKATQQLDDEADVQSSNKDCEGSSSRHLERGDPV